MTSAAEPKPSGGLELWLLRHGATEWSRNGRHTGRSDLPLLAEGEDEARALAPLLQGVAFTAVATSPLQRARRTCELAGLTEGAEVWDDLREWDYGAYEGITTAEIRRNRSDWTLWNHGCPDGEDGEAVQIRCERVIARALPLASQPPRRSTADANAANPAPPAVTMGGNGPASSAPTSDGSAASHSPVPPGSVQTNPVPDRTLAAATGWPEGVTGAGSEPSSLSSARTPRRSSPPAPLPNGSPALSREVPCRIALFAHGHLLRSLAATWLGLGARGGALFVLGTGGFSVLGYERDQRALLHWNVTIHGMPGIAGRS